jgi:hypothetical protein
VIAVQPTKPMVQIIRELLHRSEAILRRKPTQKYSPKVPSADDWFKETDPEGAAFEYEVLE